MGLIKNEVDNIDWLNKYGFKYTTNPVAGDSAGYERGYFHCNDLEYLRVNVCFPDRKVYLYNEYDCGGLLWEGELDIPDDIYSTNEEEFINWLDRELDIE